MHILLIEDDPDDVELLETAFKENGVDATFTVIAQGDKVIPYLAELHQVVDVIMLDLNLPKVPGKEILTTVKSSDIYKDLPVVILTTSSAQSDIAFCLDAGANCYFTKPSSLREFSHIVNTVAGMKVR